MRVEFRKPFKKKIGQLDSKVRSAVFERLKLFGQNPRHTLLNNHRLSGKYEGYRSINITGNWRAVFSEYRNYELVVFEAIGAHSQLYK